MPEGLAGTFQACPGPCPLRTASDIFRYNNAKGVNAMAKQANDLYTAEIPGLPARRGRPRTGHAKSNAERQAAFRAKRNAERRHVASSAADSFHRWEMHDL